MIDCKITENYFKEKARMTGNSCGKCRGCPLSFENNGVNVSCSELENKYYSKAVALVQAWSDAHPIKTYLTDFLEKYPKAQLSEDGTPAFCPNGLGYEDMSECGDCLACWNRAMAE